MAVELAQYTTSPVMELRPILKTAISNGSFLVILMKVLVLYVENVRQIMIEPIYNLILILHNILSSSVH